MKDLLQLFRWQDALDIVILSFVFYRLYLWLRKKKALRMILVILALPFYYFVAQWIDLPLSVWGLQNLWAVILLVLVVIFQQEIREVLGRITLPAFLLGKPEARNPRSEILDRVGNAAFQMMEKGIGGLIVLQRGDHLDEFIHGKIPIDAEINEDLLLCIFTPQSPLHDGAVILQDGRIRHATGLLPVSQSSFLPKEWGTRHRAGVGITEVSDAKCIIISEERREVLLASEGRIEKKKEKEDLLKSLSDALPSPDRRETKKRIPGSLLNNLPSKALFLFLVCLLWIFVIGIRQGEVSFNVPIEYYSVPQNLTITGTPPKGINARFKGSQKLLSSIEPEQFRVHVDLSNTHAGINQVSLTERDIVVPSGISVAGFSPRKITLQLSEISRPRGNLRN